MSKAVKLSFAIIIVLLLFSLGFAGYTLLQKQKIEQQRNELAGEIGQVKAREQAFTVDKQKVEEQLKTIEDEKNRIQQDFAAVNERIQKADEELKKIAQERDEWRKRLEAIQQERDRLAQQLKEQPTAAAEPKIVYKYVDRPIPIKKEAASAAQETPQPQVPQNVGDAYWAQVLKEKAALEVEIENLRKDTSQSAVEIAELRKQNNDLQLELGKLKNQQDTIDRELKYGKDLADTLSLELARVKGDNKFMNERVAKLMEESNALREQIKQLSSTKIALEKTIVRVSEDKKELEKKLTDTEQMVEGKIAEIWNIKESLNNQVQELSSASKSIELPPIVVSANNVGAPPAEGEGADVGLSGSVVSVNDENNFVIIDKGQSAGISVGNKLNIYRDRDYIAQVEVIQVRPDIAAADIKEKKTKIKVGDIVR